MALPYGRTLRTIRATRAVRIVDAPDGQVVRIAGTLRAGASTLVAPLSSRKCAAFQAEVDVWTTGTRSWDWQPLIREYEAVDFVVEDDTGRALVCADQLEAAIVLDHRGLSAVRSEGAPALDAYVVRRGHSRTDSFGANTSLQYREGVLEPGDTVAVVGRARWEEAPEPAAMLLSSYRGSVRKKRLVITAHGSSAVRATNDLPASGQAADR